MGLYGHSVCETRLTYLHNQEVVIGIYTDVILTSIKGCGTRNRSIVSR